MVARLDVGENVFVGAVVALLSATLPASLLAGETPSDGNARLQITTSQDILNRLSLAERQSGLIARISYQSCMISQGIDVDRHLADLRNSHERFITVHTGLLQGDVALGLDHAEQRARIIRSADAALSLYGESFGPAVEGILDTGKVPGDASAALFEGDRGILDALQVVATEIEAAYVNPFEVRADQALTAKVLSRQEVLVDGLARDLCLASIGRLGPERQAAAQASMEVFQASQSALINGLPGAINPAPTPEIADTLAGVSSAFNDLRPEVERAFEGQALSQADLLRHGQKAQDMKQALRAADSMHLGM